MTQEDVLKSLVTKTLTYISKEEPLPLDLQKHLTEVGLYETFKDYID